jgi:hypothetical protein
MLLLLLLPLVLLVRPVLENTTMKSPQHLLREGGGGVVE